MSEKLNPKEANKALNNDTGNKQDPADVTITPAKIVEPTKPEPLPDPNE